MRSDFHFINYADEAIQYFYEEQPKEYKLFKTVLLITALIIIFYTIFTVVILLSFFENLISLYTNDLDIIANILKLKYSFILLVSTSTIINFLCENLVIFEDYNVSLINLICFRLVGTISLSIIAHNYWNWGINSLFLSCVINNSLIVIINYFRLNYVVSSKIEEMKKKIE